MKGPGKKDPQHVWKNNNNKDVCAPMMNISNKLPKPDIILNQYN